MRRKASTPVIALALLIGCRPFAATPEELEAALRPVAYDRNVIADLSRYRSLALFLQTHKDTLIAFRNAGHVVTFVNGSRDGLRDTSYAVPDECHAFFEGNDHYDLRTVPAFLYAQLDPLFHQFPSDRIHAFEVCADGRIVIGVRTVPLSSTLEAEHELIWDPNGQRERPKTLTYTIDKDTLLPDGCIYRIGLREDLGR